MRRILLLFLTTYTISLGQSFVLKGRVTGPFGYPLPIAYLSDDSRAYKNPSMRTFADSDGFFRIVFPNCDPRHLFISGMGCYTLTVPLLIDQADSAELSVSLEPVKTSGDFSKIQVAFRPDSMSPVKRIPMNRVADGTFAVTIPAAHRVEFQIVNISRNGWPVLFGVSADEYLLSSKGEYFAVRYAVDGKAHIVFDIAKAPQPSDARFQFRDPSATISRFSRTHVGLLREYATFEDSLRRLQLAGMNASGLYSSWTDRANAFKRAMASERNPLLQGELLLRYFRLTSVSGMTLDTSIIRRYLSALPPTSPLWFFNTYEAFDISRIHPNGNAYVDSILEYHPSRELRAYLLFERAKQAQTKGHDSEVRQNYLRLKDEFGDTMWASWADDFIVADIAVKKGARVPDFTFKDMDDSATSYSRASLKGKVYLLDFWATWCLPCVGEIPYLQRAYQRFHSRGLSILSVSSDSNPDDVRKFRKMRFGMPWTHIWLPKDSQARVFNDFEITTIPKPILVSADGTIVATNLDVRGDKLEALLAKLLGQ